MRDKESGISVRRAEDGDVPAVARIWHEGWADGHVGHVPHELLPFRSRVEQFVPRARARVDSMWVAEAEGEIAGFVAVKDDEVEHIYVDRTARGTGVAARLLRTAEEAIRASGYRRAWLAVVAGNQRARSFYARLGWRDAGPFEYVAETEAGPLKIPSHRYEIDLV